MPFGPGRMFIYVKSINSFSSAPGFLFTSAQLWQYSLVEKETAASHWEALKVGRGGGV